MAETGDIVEFVGNNGRQLVWRCELDGARYNHTGMVKVKLGRNDGYSFLSSECLEHPNFLGSVKTTRSMRVIHRNPQRGESTA